VSSSCVAMQFIIKYRHQVFGWFHLERDWSRCGMSVRTSARNLAELDGVAGRVHLLVNVQPTVALPPRQQPPGVSYSGCGNVSRPARSLLAG
jgi:hypothetical protein